MREYHLRCGSDSTADANLGGALPHGHHHDVAHADGSCQQRADAHQPDEEVDTLEEVVEHLEEHLGIEYHHALLVGRIHGVGTGYDGSHAVGDRTHHHSLMSRHGDDVHGIASVVGGSEHRLW